MVRQFENRSLRIGYIKYPGYVENCAFENFYECPRPGAVAETLDAFASFFSAKLEFFPFPAFGEGMETETDTVFRGLMNGTIHASGPNLLYLDDRIRHVPNFTFPVGTIINFRIFETFEILKF